MDLMERLARNVVDTKYEALSPEVVNTVKICVLDTMGVLIAGATAPGCKEVLGWVKEMGGREEHSPGLGRQVPGLQCGYGQ